MYAVVLQTMGLARVAADFVHSSMTVAAAVAVTNMGEIKLPYLLNTSE